MSEGLFYFTPKADPYFAMAFDAWLFERCCAQNPPARAVLRLYSWNCPAVTVGYNQNAEEVVDMASLPENTPVIRRITGGRAIYHDCDEITFSLGAVLTELPLPARTLSGANSLVSETIVDVLRRLGIEAVWARHSDAGFRKQTGARVRSCFDSISRYEITVGGQKVVGIAQRRRGDCLIQQGSIKINGITDNPAVRQTGRPVPVEVSPSVGRGKTLTPDSMREIFQDVFSNRLAVTFQPGELSSDDCQAVSILQGNLMHFPLEK
ncbi:MAG: lipoate--protein ligase family protein [candidate division Zixibacteria bacterium]|nr:lipoate--protein ligase family protein [candidate division Zixibacteria bacterium]